MRQRTRLGDIPPPSQNFCPAPGTVQSAGPKAAQQHTGDHLITIGLNPQAAPSMCAPWHFCGVALHAGVPPHFSHSYPKGPL
jgi:hypothetical protein